MQSPSTANQLAINQSSLSTGTWPGAGPWINCYRVVRNQRQICPKVSGTTDIRNILRVPLTTTNLQVGPSYYGMANPDLSLN